MAPLGLLALFAGGCATDEGEGELVLANRAPVQYNFVGWGENALQKGVSVVTTAANTRKARSVGAIRPEGEKWMGSTGAGEGNCGSTFITPHYAITAAHCVSKADLPAVWTSAANPGSRFRIEQINASGLTLNDLIAQARVNGGTGWPNWTRPNPLTPGAAYSVTTYFCHVKARCDSNAVWGRDNCPVDFPPESDPIDIALVYCPTRPASSTWSRVATSAETNPQPVEIWWFHEVLNLASSTTLTNPYQPANNWEHYFTKTSTAVTENYHYNNANGTHQLLPLVSWKNINGQRYQTLANNGSHYRDVNVPACHGTSGSGVFKGSAFDDADPQFLGPTVHGGTWGGSQLCADINTSVTTLKQLDYAKREFSQLLEATVIGDR